MRSAEEIREYLIDQLNSVMKRPGPDGGRGSVETLRSALAFVDAGGDGRDQQDYGDPDPASDLELPDPDGRIRRALDLPLLYRLGWFRPWSTLTAAGYAELLTTLDPWLADVRRQCDVVRAFGAPSWRDGDVLAYATADPADPMVVFIAHDDAVTAAWTSEGRFPAGLRLTTAGKQLLADRPAS